MPKSTARNGERGESVLVGTSHFLFVLLVGIPYWDCEGNPCMAFSIVIRLVGFFPFSILCLPFGLFCILCMYIFNYNFNKSDFVPI